MKAIKLGKLNAAPHDAHTAQASVEQPSRDSRDQGESPRRSVADRVRAAAIRAAFRRS